MKPTTLLPWSLASGHFQHLTGEDAAYIVHACNAYPRLIACIHSLIPETVIEDSKQAQNAINAHALLRELEEVKP